MAHETRRALQRLAGLYGVQTAYYDVKHRRHTASPDALLAVLRELGAPVATASDAPAALRERLQALWQRCVEPVVVLWTAESVDINIRLPANRAAAQIDCQVTFEHGTQQHHRADMDLLPVLQEAEVEGQRYVMKKLCLPLRVPMGYHRLALEVMGEAWQALLIAAPRRMYGPDTAAVRHHWGVFAPLYALHSRQSWGAGDASDLQRLVHWTADRGGRVVATLPLLSSFLDEPFDPSPYAPVSRLFWNELYVDVTRAPELQQCPEAHHLLNSAAFQEALARMRTAPLVDYRGQMALKRRVLEVLARTFFQQPAPARQHAFNAFLAAYPAADDYARFRAACERLRRPWTAWPAPLRDGVLTEGAYDEQAQQYHLYGQWLAHEQFTVVAEQSMAREVSLYLDLPLGVHTHGYDVWRERQAFALGATAGAPPDTFFSGGQNWGFPPLHPEAIRLQEYRYPIAYLRHQLSQAGILRIDHVMGLHRLFWIPQGFEAAQGLYVRYQATDLYAIVSLESHRHHTCIVGENLGTVPAYVNTAMARHQLYGMYVLQYMLRPGRRAPLRPVPARVVASLNTHDVFPFAAFWKGLDIVERHALGLADSVEVAHDLRHRDTLKQALEDYLRQRGWLSQAPREVQSVLRACLAYLAASAAQVMLVNLEDLWLELRPQNVPGTADERPNWQRKLRYTFEEFQRMPQVLEVLRDVERLRRREKERV